MYVTGLCYCWFLPLFWYRWSLENVSIIYYKAKVSLKNTFTFLKVLWLIYKTSLDHKDYGMKGEEKEKEQDLVKCMNLRLCKIFIIFPITIPLRRRVQIWELHCIAQNPFPKFMGVNPDTVHGLPDS